MVLPQPVLVAVDGQDTPEAGSDIRNSVAGAIYDGAPKTAFMKPGDTVRIETEVLELRESRSRPDNGIVIFQHRAFNQNDVLVGICKRTALMHRKPAG